MTHFADADTERGIAQQVAVFDAATHDLPGERSLSNSAATLRHCAAANVRADWVRAGIMSYGSVFTAQQRLRIGIVACGYADGYPRHCPTGTPVLVEGVRTRTLGRVSMDMLAVDLSPMPTAQIGSEVTLWGLGPHGEVLSIDEVARSAGTIGYEPMCALAQRVPVTVL